MVLVFGQGQYAPETHAGKKLIAHELTHTMQNGSVQRNVIQRRSNPYWEQGSEPVEEKSAKEKPGFFTRVSIKTLIKLLQNMPDYVFGTFSMAGVIFKYGAIGFLQRLAQAGKTKIKTAFFNARRAFTSMAYLKGLLKGIWHGFKDIGFWGTVDLFKMIITLPKTLFTFGEKVFSFLGSGGLSKAARGIGSRMVSLGKWLTANGKKVIQELFAGGASFNSKAVGAFFNNMVKSAKGAVQKAGSKIADSLLKFFLRPIKKIGSDVGHAIGTVVGAVLFEIVFALITAGIGLGVSAAKGVVKSIVGLMARAGRKIVQVARLVVGKVWNLLSKCGNGLVRFVMKMSPTLGKKFGELVGTVRAFVGKLWKRVQGAKGSSKYIPEITIKNPADRHFFHKIIQGNKTARARGNVTTVPKPKVNMSADISAINNGKGIKLPNNQVKINKRVYGIHSETGRAYPVKGDGFVQLTRGAYKAVGVFNKFDGKSQKALNILKAMHDVTKRDIKKALKLWRMYNP